MAENTENQVQNEPSIKEYNKAFDKISKIFKKYNGKDLVKQFSLAEEPLSTILPIFKINKTDVVNEEYLKDKSNIPNIQKKLLNIANKPKNTPYKDLKDSSMPKEVWNKVILGLIGNNDKSARIVSITDKLKSAYDQPKGYNQEDIIEKWTNFATAFVESSADHLAGVVDTTDLTNKNNNIDMKALHSKTGDMIYKDATCAEDMIKVDCASWACNDDNKKLEDLAKEIGITIQEEAKDPTTEIHLMPLPNSFSNMAEMNKNMSNYVSCKGIYAQPEDVMNDPRMGDVKQNGIVDKIKNWDKNIKDKLFNKTARGNSVENKYKEVLKAYYAAMDKARKDPKNMTRFDKLLSPDGQVGKLIDEIELNPYTLPFKMALSLWRNRDVFRKLVRSAKIKFPKLYKFAQTDPKTSEADGLGEAIATGELRLADILKIAEYYEKNAPKFVDNAGNPLTNESNKTQEAKTESFEEFCRNEIAKLLTEVDVDDPDRQQAKENAAVAGVDNKTDPKPAENQGTPKEEPKTDQKPAENQETEELENNSTGKLSDADLQNIDKIRNFLAILIYSFLSSFEMVDSLKETNSKMEGVKFYSGEGNKSGSFLLAKLAKFEKTAQKETNREKTTEGSEIDKDAVIKVINKAMSKVEELKGKTFNDLKKEEKQKIPGVLSLYKSQASDEDKKILDYLEKNKDKLNQLLSEKMLTFRDFYFLNESERDQAENKNGGNKESGTPVKAAQEDPKIITVFQPYAGPSENNEDPIISDDSKAKSMGPIRGFLYVLISAYSAWAKMSKVINDKMVEAKLKPADIEYTDLAQIGPLESLVNVVSTAETSMKDLSTKSKNKFFDGIYKTLEALKEVKYENLTIHNFEFTNKLIQALPKPDAFDFTPIRINEDIKTLPNCLCDVYPLADAKTVAGFEEKPEQNGAEKTANTQADRNKAKTTQPKEQK